jgi:hypothetical protein
VPDIEPAEAEAEADAEADADAAESPVLPLVSVSPSDSVSGAMDPSGPHAKPNPHKSTTVDRPQTMAGRISEKCGGRVWIRPSGM